MSGALSSGSILPATISGLLATAAFRGVTFSMVDASEAAGRRWVSFLFPGRDDQDWEDLGAKTGDLRVTGLIGGDDYVIRANRLRQAFLAPGPGILIHPWLGQITVVLREPAEITFKDDELRVARFQATFQRFSPTIGPPTDTLGALLDAADGMLDAAQIAIASALGVAVLPLALYSAASSFIGQAAGVFDALFAGGAGASDLRTAAQPSITALSAGIPPPAAGAGAAFADQVASVLSGPPAAIADAAATAVEPAIGPASTAASTAAATTDPADAATLLLSASANLAPIGASVAARVAGSPLPVLAVAARAMVLSQAIGAASSVAFGSQQDAIGWRTRLDAALAALGADIVAVAPAWPVAAAALWQALRAMRSALAADINARLGRLPAVVTLTTARTMSAWLVALHVSGDTPGAMLATLTDLVTRNGVRNPALVPAGPVQVLAS